MAYENMTYEYILNRMMSRVTEQYPNLDNREGSIIFNALAGAAIELAIAYSEIDNAMSESWVDTATRDYLLLGCKDRGIDITQFEATYGWHKGEFNVEVPIGSRWSCDLYNYEVIEYVGYFNNYHLYMLQCETIGSSPNNTVGDLIPITDNPNGLSHSKIVECLVEGENEKSDDEIRKTYYEYINNTIGDGNKAQYKQWCDEYNGVGNHKIFPLWNGANTVKVSILSSSNGVASEDLVNSFQEYLDPNSSGMGDGKAPIGAYVTVTTATEFPLEIRANVTLANGYTTTTQIDEGLAKYFSEISYANDNPTVVAYMTVGAKMLACEGVVSINNLTINGGTEDITLGVEEIPTLSSGNWVVS